MFGRQLGTRERLLDLIEKLCQKGAVSPERAMTAEELGLPPRFEEAMKRHLGRLGIFIEVDGKYYVSEERLKQLEKLWSARGKVWDQRKRIITLRLIRLVTVAIFATLLLVNLFVHSWELRIVSFVFIAVWLVLLILQIYYSLRVRKRAPSWPRQV